CRFRKYYFFFFSSRRRHTRLQGDWSSDVCSSDLSTPVRTKSTTAWVRRCSHGAWARNGSSPRPEPANTGLQRRRSVRCSGLNARSEERRVGKEGRTGWAARDDKKNKEYDTKQTTT